MASNKTNWLDKRNSNTLRPATTCEFSALSELEDVAWIWIFRLLHLLPSDQREILRRADLMGEPIDAIAATEQIPPEDVVKMLDDARKTICGFFGIAPLAVSRMKRPVNAQEATRMITRLFGEETQK